MCQQLLNMLRDKHCSRLNDTAMQQANNDAFEKLQFSKFTNQDSGVLCAGGWELVLICYERKVLLAGWWLVLI